MSQDLSVVRTTPTPTAKTHHHHHHHSHHRTHSVGQPAHRITRRKSMSANATTIAAVAQVVSEAVHHSSISPAATGATATAGTTGLANKVGPVSPADLVPPPPPPSGYPSPPSSLPTPGPLGAAETTSDSIQQLRNTSVGLAGSAIADGHAPDLSRGARSRRASEGAGVLGPTGKIGRMRSGSELKCDKCGKGYKHSSCLTKHLFVFPPLPSLPPSRVFRGLVSLGTRTAFLSPPSPPPPPNPHLASQCQGVHTASKGLHTPSQL